MLVNNLYNTLVALAKSEVASPVHFTVNGVKGTLPQSVCESLGQPKSRLGRFFSKEPAEVPYTTIADTFENRVWCAMQPLRFAYPTPEWMTVFKSGVNEFETNKGSFHVRGMWEANLLLGRQNAIIKDVVSAGVPEKHQKLIERFMCGDIRMPILVAYPYEEYMAVVTGDLKFETVMRPEKEALLQAVRLSQAGLCPVTPRPLPKNPDSIQKALLLLSLHSACQVAAVSCEERFVVTAVGTDGTKSAIELLSSDFRQVLGCKGGLREPVSGYSKAYEGGQDKAVRDYLVMKLRQGLVTDLDNNYDKIASAAQLTIPGRGFKEVITVPGLVATPRELVIG